MKNIKNEILEALKDVKDPELKRDIVSLGMVKEIGITGKNAFIHLEVTSPNPSLRQSIKELTEKRLASLRDLEKVQVQVSTGPQKGPSFSSSLPLQGIQHVIAVASGKGGVGKTTTAVNLAYALIKLGNKVGLMDGDIYGPNVPLMVGIPHDQRPAVNDDDKMVPISVNGLKVISMGILVPPDQPMVWRGPMLHGAVTQFLQKVDWGELDYLVVDLPPGTGDVQLSLVQSVPLSGAVVVTTPQEVSLLDVRKAITMFQKTNVPILGILENMTGEIFGSGGGSKMASQSQVPFLGGIPLDSSVRQGGDAGKPIILSVPDSVAAGNFLKAAELLVEKLKQAVNT